MRGVFTDPDFKQREEAYLRLEFLCELDDLEDIRQAVAAGASVDWRPSGRVGLLEKSASQGHVEVVRLLVELGASALDVNLNEVRDEAVMEVLLSAGADPNRTDKEGWTVLHQVCTMGREDLAFCLLRHGANLDAKDRDGYTPIRAAREMARAGLADALESYQQQLHIDSQTPPATSMASRRRI